LEHKWVWADHKYHDIRKAGNRITLDNNTITLHPRTLNIYSKQEFKGDAVEKVDFIAENYWEPFFRMLENKLSIVILKEGRHNIRLCRVHYADVHNNIAEEMRNNKQKLKIYDYIDGRLRLITDFSNLNDELETLHPEKASEDMLRIKKQLNDFMNNNPPTNTELAIIVKSSLNLQIQTQEQLKITALSLQSVSKQIDSIVKLLNLLIPKPEKELKSKSEKVNYEDCGIV